MMMLNLPPVMNLHEKRCTAKAVLPPDLSHCDNSLPDSSPYTLATLIQIN